jgi:hypothetical protein
MASTFDIRKLRALEIIQIGASVPKINFSLSLLTRKINALKKGLAERSFIIEGRGVSRIHDPFAVVNAKIDRLSTFHWNV